MRQYYDKTVMVGLDPIWKQKLNLSRLYIRNSVLIRFFLFFFTLTSFDLTLALAADEDAIKKTLCTEILASANKGTTDFPKWNPGEMPPLALPEDLLPIDYVKEIRDAGYEVEIKTGRNNYGYTTQIVSKEKGSTAYKLILSFEIEYGNVSAPAQIENLTFTDPIASRKTTSRIYKKTQGASLQVFRHAQKNLEELLRKGGYKSYVAYGIQNYLVAQLYRKIAGMRPMTIEGERFYENLEKLYVTASKEFPEEYKIKSLDDFAFRLGNSKDKITDIEYAIETLKKYPSLNKTSLDLFRNGNQILGFGEKINGKVMGPFFVQDFGSGIELLTWRTLIHKSRKILFLQKSL